MGRYGGNAEGVTMRYLQYALLGLVALAAVLLVSGQDTVAAQTEFNPATRAALSTLTPGAPVDIDTEFCLGTGPTHVSCPSPTTGDVNLSGIAIFTPSEFGVALDADVPDGAIVARFHDVSP